MGFVEKIWPYCATSTRYFKKKKKKKKKKNEKVQNTVSQPNMYPLLQNDFGN